MDRHDQVPVMVSHFLETDVAKYARIVDEYVDASVCLDSGLNYLIAFDNIIVIRNGLSP